MNFNDLLKKIDECNEIIYGER
ncbi:TPA: hypothetical protein ACJK88_002946, partial [Acinetobacter baumannii]|nr:hypothetical protein [Acinetobacter baumannii]